MSGRHPGLRGAMVAEADLANRARSMGVKPGELVGCVGPLHNVVEGATKHGCPLCRVLYSMGATGLEEGPATGIPGDPVTGSGSASGVLLTLRMRDFRTGEAKTEDWGLGLFRMRDAVISGQHLTDGEVLGLLDFIEHNMGVLYGAGEQESPRS